MTSDLLPAYRICEFVYAGPKNYAFKTVNTETGEHKTVCKVIARTLNYSASLIMNFEKIREIILKRDDSETVTVRTD